MSVRRQFLLFIAFPVLICNLGSRSFNSRPDKEQLKIAVRWVKSQPGEPWQDVRKGLIWGFSHLGAELPAGAFDRSISPSDANIYWLDFNALGFSEQAKIPLAAILDSLKNTGEYQSRCGIDLGRLLVLLCHSPQHYYAITGIPSTYADFRAAHEMDQTATYVFPVLRSSIAFGNRLLEFREGPSPTDFAFIAKEGRGSWELGNFQVEEYEVFDVMANGQLRFAIYNRDGALENATPSHLAEAGKPGKCMWCHESSIQPLFSRTFHVPGFMSPDDFDAQVLQMRARLHHFQRAKRSEVQFENVYDHTQQELLYIGFMEPTAERLALEWGVALSEAKRRLSGCRPHRHAEFPQLGWLYERCDVDALAPYSAARVPESVREPSDFEPNFIGK